MIWILFLMLRKSCNTTLGPLRSVRNAFFFLFVWLAVYLSTESVHNLASHFDAWLPWWPNKYAKLSALISQARARTHNAEFVQVLIYHLCWFPVQHAHVLLFKWNSSIDIQQAIAILRSIKTRRNVTYGRCHTPIKVATIQSNYLKSIKCMFIGFISKLLTW